MGDSTIVTRSPCGHCGSTYKHTDTVGCCSGCGRVFYGLTAFERHRVNLACRDVENAIRKDGSRLFTVKRTDKGAPLWRLADSARSTPNPRTVSPETTEQPQGV